MQIDEVAGYFGKIDNLLRENEALRSKLEYKETIINGYHLELKDMQDQILNHKGALKRQGDEIHVLYHKISTLLEDNKPENYSKNGDAGKRNILHQILDTIKPTEIEFTYGAGHYTLTDYGITPGINPVSHYPEEKLYFC